MQNIQKAQVTWVEFFGFTPRYGLTYKVWFKTLKTGEEGSDFVFSETSVRCEDIIFVEKQGDSLREVSDVFHEHYLTTALS